LTWLDRSSEETGFRIERASGTSLFARIATVGANVTSYADSTVVQNVTYHYRVQAYTPAVASAYSNTASATR
jgi:hypothetical protein